MGRLRDTLVAGFGGGRFCVEGLEARRMLVSAAVLDASFDGDGIARMMPRTFNDLTALTVLGDRRVVGVGTTQSAGGNKDLVVVRRNADGSADTTFNGTGFAFLDLGADDVGTAVDVAGDGSVYVAGVTGNDAQGTGDMFVARYTAAGALDTTFNAGKGYRTLDFGGLDSPSGISVSDVEKIVVAGASTNLLAGTGGIAFGFLNKDGTVDVTRGNRGWTLTTPGAGRFEGATSLKWIGSHYLVSGYSADVATQKSRFMVAEFDRNGFINKGFGEQGYAYADFGRNVELAMDAKFDWKNQVIWATGVSADGKPDLFAPGLPTGPLAANPTVSDYAVARWDLTGAPDLRMLGTGRTLVTLGGDRLSAATGIGLQSDDKVLIGGGTQNRATGLSDTGLARLNWDGTVDTDFGTNGRQILDLGASDGGFRSLFTDIAEYYVAGHDKTATDGEMFMMRLLLGLPPYPPKPPLFSASAVRLVDAAVNGVANVPVRLTRAFDMPVTVNYATRDGGLVAGTDYDAAMGTLTFAPGELEKLIPVTYHDSHEGLSARYFGVSLYGASAGGFASPYSTATLDFKPLNQNVLRSTRLLAAGLPAQVTAGQKSKAFANVTIHNTGDAPLKGSGVVNVYGSTDRRFNAGDVLMGTLKAKYSILPDSLRTYKVPIKTIPGTLPAEMDLYLVGTATGAGVSRVETNYSVGDDVFRVTRPTVTLVGAAGPAVSVASGGKANFTLPVTNSGSVAAVGTITADLRIAAGGTQYFFNRSAKVNIPAGATRNVTFSTNLRVNGGTPVPAGSYTMVVRLLTSKLAVPNTTDGSVLGTVPLTNS